MDKQLGLAHDTAPTVDDVMALWEGHEKRWLSRKEIADALGRVKSPTLITVIGIAQGMGYLTMKSVQLPNGVPYFQYRPTIAWTQRDQPY